MSVPQQSFEPDAACPLDGVRVVDMSRLVAGNAVSSQLADFGAEVVKIEDPGKGDPLRAWQTNGVSVHWKLYARNKKSVALSLRPARGRELLLDLISTAEVLIENFRPGTLEKMGLAPAELHRRNPRLIIVRVSGWGQDGPYKDRPGFGTLVESLSGYASRTGFADREPVLPPTALADMVAGLYGAFAVMVALRRVEVEGGGGQVIDLPLLDPLFSFIATEAPIYNLTKQVRPRTGSRSETTSPRNVFRTKDGRYIGISASIQAMSERLFRAIGREDMIADPRFANNTMRVKNAEETEAPIVAQTDIDAPESGHGTNRPGQPYSGKATALLKSLALGRQATASCYDIDARPRADGTTRERYICRVYVDGTDANMAMLDAGMAMAYRQNPRYVRDRTSYRHEDAAKARRLGIWSQPAPIPPWEWRQACWVRRHCDGAGD